MLFQTRKTFAYLQNTNQDMFDEIRELSEALFTLVRFRFKTVL